MFQGKCVTRAIILTYVLIYVLTIGFVIISCIQIEKKKEYIFVQAFVLTTVLIVIILEKTKSSKGGRPKGNKTKGKDDPKPDPKKGKDDPKKGDPTPDVQRSSL